MLTFDAEKGVIVRDYEEEYNSIISSERFYAREEGIEQGREQAIKNSILNMKNNGLDNNTIIKFLNIDEATLKITKKLLGMKN